MSEAVLILQRASTSSLVERVRDFKLVQKWPTRSVAEHLHSIESYLEESGFEGCEVEVAQWAQMALCLVELELRGIKRI